jgi:glycine/D-amino acid oxidase-like deaminating enzyme
MLSSEFQGTHHVGNVSYWERHLTHCDVLIVGAGFLGSWLAKYLAAQHPGLRVIVTERSNKSYGASIRNAGFATSGSITEILADERNFGTEAAFNIVRQRREGIAKIEEQFDIFGLSGFNRCGGYELFTPENKDQIIDNIGRINSALGGFELRDDGVFVEDDGLLNSWKLLDLLHHTTEWEGCQDFIFGADVNDLHETPDGVRAIVGLHGRNITIDAKKVILCMNGFTHTLIPMTQIRPQRNHVMVTAPLDIEIPECGFHAEEGYIYWRPVYEGEQTRLLIGGMRHRSFDTENTRSFSHNQFIWDELTRFVEENITDQFTIDYQWTGIMGFTGNKQNLLERHAENIYAACCCNGQGVAMAPVFAQEIVDTVFPK